MGGAISAAIDKTIGGDDLLEDPNTWTPTDAQVEVLRTIFGDVTNLVDYHTHVAGLQEGCSGCYVHKSMYQRWHIWSWFSRKAFVSALAGPEAHKENIDEVVMQRMVRLTRHMNRMMRMVQEDKTMRHVLLAFDAVVDEKGNLDRNRTGLHVPNQYVDGVIVQQAAKDIYHMAMSVHPYRHDAKELINMWADAGVRVMKWLPNSMRIDPSSDLCIPSYKAMRERGIILLIHTGTEHSVVAGGVEQNYGNPLLMRKALDHGVKVIAAHCASEGESKDLDNDGQLVNSYDLLKRLFDEPAYEELLFADISAITGFKRLDTLEKVLADSSIHHRLVNGTDYPVPALNIVVQTSCLVKRGLLSKDHKTIVDELYHVNPLLFDYAVKRLLKCPRTGNTFPPGLFEEHSKLTPYADQQES